MADEKSVNNEGQLSKKSSSDRKNPAQKSQKENPKPAKQATSTDTLPVAALANKIGCIADEIRNNPVKSFDKKDRLALIQSYEKLIAGLVREINCSRQ